jgi:HK97 gp10 family phage protein
VAEPGVTGLAETLAALRQLPEVAAQQGVLRRALVKAAQPIADTAVRLAPDDPRTPAPDLRSSIRVATQLTKWQRRQTAKENEVEVYVGPTTQPGRAVLRYASNVEFGTFRAAPHPYLRPAFEAAQGAVMEILTRELSIELDKAITKISRKQAKTK